ncbi:MAG: hypothetical protein KDD29_03145 [Flavobacteriales bacterium]|nr:hypothetical protein [Flavobacteriales bacterium]
MINDDENIQIKKIESDDFSKQLLNLKVGDEINRKQLMGNKTDRIRIVGIVNKYLALKLEIMKETDNPHSGLGLQSFKLEDGENPLDMLLSILPPIEERVDPFDEYYSEKLTFSQLPWMSSELNQNLIHTYYKLVNDYKGLIKVGLTHFLSFPVIKEPNFILDFTSLPHFFELCKKGELELNVKFKISSYTKVLLKQYKENNLSYRKTEKYTLDLDYYTELEQWIKEYCEEVSPTSLLDMTSDREPIKEPLVMYLLSNSAMLDEVENSILITDDLTYYRIYPIEMNKLVSTNFFLIYHQLLSKFGLVS